MCWNCVSAIILVSLLPGCSASEGSAAVRLRTNIGVVKAVEVRVAPGRGSGGADICVLVDSKELCYTSILDGRPFPLDPVWSPAMAPSKPDEVAYLLFSAGSTPGFSRQGQYLALLSLNLAIKRLENVLPRVVLSEQSDFSIWQDSRYSTAPILSTADFRWDLAGETHFGPHRYWISTYVLASGGRYALSDKYLTNLEYPGFDDAPFVDVVAPEMENIRRRLAAKLHQH